MGLLSDIKKLREFGEGLDSLEDEFKYLREHNVFEEFEKMIKSMEKMLRYMEGLNKSMDKMVNIMESLDKNIVSFNKSIQQISENTQVIGELEKRISLTGFVFSTIKDIFVLIRQIIRIAVLRNLERLKGIRGEKKE